MTQLALSNDLTTLTAEINSYKQVAGQAVFEIGKRLKHVRDGLQYGEYDNWCEAQLGFTRRTSNRFIQSFEQFGNGTTSSQLETSKIFELLSLPEPVDRQEFIAQPHTVPSTGESKTVDEMTVRELREVKKALQESEARAKREEQEKNHWQGVAKSQQNMSPRVVTQTVEVVPDTLKKKLGDLEYENTNLKHGYREAKEKLQQYEIRDTDGYDAEQSQRELEKLQRDADTNTVQLRLAFKQFIEKAAITTFLQAAIAYSTPSEKERLSELVEATEQIIGQTKLALRGRKLGVVNE